MSRMDETFVENCREILDHGFSTEGQTVRAHWPDGTPAYTIKQFGIVNRYDLSKEMPLMTLRPTAWKTATDEILWIWKKKSNDVRDLGRHIWDAWAGEDHTIGKAYGYQLSKKYKFAQGEMDQVDNVLWQLKNNPQSRRILTNMYNFQDLSEMNLEPCAYSMTFNVTGDRLNAVLNQRSQDMLTANAFNVFQYSLLVYMFAQVSGLKPGQLVHVIADAHIYDRHVPIIRELIERKQYPAPDFRLNPEVKDFYDFRAEDVIVENYQAGPQVRDIPVAE